MTKTNKINTLTRKKKNSFINRGPRGQLARFLDFTGRKLYYKNSFRVQKKKKVLFIFLKYPPHILSHTQKRKHIHGTHNYYTLLNPLTFKANCFSSRIYTCCVLRDSSKPIILNGFSFDSVLSFQSDSHYFDALFLLFWSLLYL